MTVADDLLENDARHAESVAGSLPRPPAQHVAVFAIRANPFVPKGELAEVAA